MRRYSGPLLLALAVAAGSASGCVEETRTRNPNQPNAGQWTGAGATHAQAYPGQANPGYQPYPGQPYPGQQPYPGYDPSQGYPQGTAYPQPYPSGTTYPQPYPTGTTPVPTATVTPTATATTTTTAAPTTMPPVGTLDPINSVDVQGLRRRAGAVLGELVAALPEKSKSKVQSIPLFADPTVGEVNAFAACDDQGAPLMAVSDGLLEVMAFSARAKAADELFGGNRLQSYTQLVASGVKPKTALPRPGADFISPTQDNDPRKLARQSELFDEEVAFVLGHELAHHHLGHTGCANGGGSKGIGTGDFGRLLSRTLPLFNHPNEVASDVAGTNNLLSAGKSRSVVWNEEGALLTLGFFSALDQLTPQSVLFTFESSHPSPSIRIPIVQQTASSWRMTGGASASSPLPLPLPF